MPSASGIRAGRAFVEVGMRDKLTAGLKRLQGRFKNFGAGMARIGAKLSAASALALTPVAFATKTFADFSDQMSTVRAVTGATETQFKSLSEQAKELGRTTSFMAAQVAGAQVELGRAGFTPSEILKATPAVLSLARATGTELPRAAEIAGQALRGFNLDAADTARVADVLTSTANNSAQQLDDIGESLKFVAPLAAEAGASIESTAAALGVLANNGIKGTAAGTALARAYKNLSTTAAQNKLKGLGVDVLDNAKNLRSVSTILAELGERTRGLGSGERLNIFETLFGRGQAAALKLAGPGGMFDDLKDKIDDSAGAADKAAGIMDDNLGGSFRKLLSATEGIQIAIGEALAPAIRSIAATLTEASGAITKFLKENKGLVIAVTAGVAAAGLLGIAMVGVGGAIVAAGAALGAVTTLLVAAKAIIGLMLTPIGLVTVGIGSLAAVVLVKSGAMKTALGFLGEKFGELRGRALEAFGGIRDALAAGDIKLAAKILWLGLKAEWLGGTSFILEKTLGMRDSFSDAVNLMQDAWAVFTNEFMKSWEIATAFISKKLLPIAELIENSNPDALLKNLARQFANPLGISNEGIDPLGLRPRGEAEKRLDADAKAKNAERDRGLIAGVGQRAKENADRKAAFREQIEAAKLAQEAARAQLAGAIQSAKSARIEAEFQEALAFLAGLEPSGGGGVGINPQKIAQTITAAAGRVLDPVSIRSKEGIDRVLRATQGIGGTDPQTEQLNEQRKTNQKMDKLIRKGVVLKPADI